jgi:hypothetical protein
LPFEVVSTQVFVDEIMDGPATNSPGKKFNPRVVAVSAGYRFEYSFYLNIGRNLHSALLSTLRASTAISTTFVRPSFMRGTPWLGSKNLSGRQTFLSPGSAGPNLRGERKPVTSSVAP